MKNSYFRDALVLFSLIFFSTAANAALHGRLPVTPGGTDYQAYYDDHLNLTFLVDANLAASNTFGLPVGVFLGPHSDDSAGELGDGFSDGFIRASGSMNYPGALHWIDAMNAANYLGISGWQLPSTGQLDETCSRHFIFTEVITGAKIPQDYGTGCTGSTMGHLFYEEGIRSYARPPFLNVVSGYYVSSTEFEPNVYAFAWGLHMGTGYQDFRGKLGHLYAWPVRGGDVTSSPPDFDLDGIPDAAELNGIDVDGDGTLEFNLSELGADPCRKTIVVEIDYMDGSITGFIHEPHPDLIATVAAAFDAAPIPAAADCPFEGFPTQPGGVNFIAIIDDEVPEQDGKFSHVAELNSVRETYFNEDLLPWLHYALYVHALDDGDGTSGVCCNKGSFLVSLGNFSLDSTTNPPDRVKFYDPDGDQLIKLRNEAGTFMHELGHALGLPHGGDENTNFKPNYVSIMNYLFQTSWLTSADDPSIPILDYSRVLLPELDERELYEVDVLCDHPECEPLETAWLTPLGERGAGAIRSPLNWNDENGIQSLPVAVDINGRNTKCVGDGPDDVLDTAPAGDDVVDLPFIKSGPDRVCDTTKALGSDDSQLAEPGSKKDVGLCVGDGPDDVLETTPEGDDVVELPYIKSGPNLICETTKATDSDDSQLAEPGTLPGVVYDGHDDWAAIKFLAAENAYGAGVASLEISDIEEITAEEAEEIDAFWVQVREELLAENENLPPTADPQSVTLNEDTAKAITLTGSDVDAFPVTPVVYDIVSGPANGALNGTLPNLIYTPDLHFFGIDSFTFRTYDGELYSSSATVEITIEAVNDAPTISISRSTASLQYSDSIGTVTITATDVDDHPLVLTSGWKLDNGAANAGLPAALGTSGSCTPETTDFSPVSGTSCSWILSGQMLEPSGDYDISFTVTDGGGATITNLDTTEYTELKIAPEDASIAFDEANPVAVQVVGDGGKSGSFDLTVEITESLPENFTFAALPGDIGTADVSMTLSPIGPGQSATGACLTSATDPVSDGYTQAQTVVCTFDDLAVNTYSAAVTVNGGFYTGSAEDVLTVYDPSLGFTTGGGWFYWPGTDDRTNFGYTMKYGKQGKRVKGSLLLIRHLTDKSGKYRIKSNALEGLALGEDSTIPMGWASFNGKNTYIEPGWEDAQGNYEFTVYVEDHNDTGAGTDRLWIQARDKNDLVIDVMSMPRPASGNSILIEGGNIFVPQ
jgi:hypothetical protein